MRVRRAQRLDLPHIAAIQTESWKDAYADFLPGAYLAGQLAGYLERHYHPFISTQNIYFQNVALIQAPFFTSQPETRNPKPS